MNAQFYYERGMERLSSRQFAEAMWEFDRAIRRDDNFAEAYRRLADTCYFTMDMEEAADRYETYLARFAEDAERSHVAEAYYNCGHALSTTQRFSDAVDIFTRLIELSPSGRSYCERGQIHQSLGRMEDALADYDMGIEVEPGYSANYYHKDEIYGTQGRQTELVATSYEDLLRCDPHNDIAHYFMGERCESLGQYEKALAHFESAAAAEEEEEDGLGLRSAFFDPCERKARIQLEMGGYDEAIATYNFVIERHYVLYRVYLERGRSYHERGDYNRALADYDQVINMTSADDMPSANDETYYRRGLTYLCKAEYKNALDDFDLAIEINPDRSEYREWREEAYLRLSRDA